MIPSYRITRFLPHDQQLPDVTYLWDAIMRPETERFENRRRRDFLHQKGDGTALSWDPEAGVVGADDATPEAGEIGPPTTMTVEILKAALAKLNQPIADKEALKIVPPGGLSKDEFADLLKGKHAADRAFARMQEQGKTQEQGKIEGADV